LLGGYIRIRDTRDIRNIFQTTPLITVRRLMHSFNMSSDNDTTLSAQINRLSVSGSPNVRTMAFAARIRTNIIVASDRDTAFRSCARCRRLVEPIDQQVQHNV
jgi:hypothetical protein